MAEIKNLGNLTNDDITRELQNGAKFVIFQYAISIFILTFKRSSDVYFIRAGESTFKYRIVFSLITWLFGWWGIPWGPIYSIGALVNNVSGGKDVTREITTGQQQ